MSKPRTIEEVKNDIRERVGRRAPFLHADKSESEEALAKMPNFEGETWAAAWNDLGARWEEKANAAEKAGNAREAKDGVSQILRLLRHRPPSVSEHARQTPRLHENPRDVSRRLEIFRHSGRTRSDSVSRTKPSSVICDCRKKLPAPMIMHWGGIDNWKEERHSFGESFVKEGWGCFIIDSPGTGECPMLAGPDAHQVHTAVLDYLLNGPKSTPTRSPSSAPASAATGRPSWPISLPTNCAPRSIGAAAFIIFFNPSGRNARATPTPIFST